MRETLLGKQKYNLILMDPPWANKHIKRTLKRRKLEQKLKNDSTDRNGEMPHTDSYEMLENDIISHQLDIDELLSPDGVLVIYCTNSKKNQNSITEWLDKWKLVYVTKWYWLKVIINILHAVNICSIPIV